MTEEWLLSGIFTQETFHTYFQVNEQSSDKPHPQEQQNHSFRTAVFVNVFYVETKSV